LPGFIGFLSEFLSDSINNDNCDESMLKKSQQDILILELGKLITRVESILERMDVQMEQTQRIKERLDTLDVEYTRFKSFFGGVVFVSSAIWTFVVFSWNNIRDVVSRATGTH